MEPVRRKRLVEALIAPVCVVFSGGLILFFVRPSPEDIRAFYSWENLGDRENRNMMLPLVFLAVVIAIASLALWCKPALRQRSVLRWCGFGVGVYMLISGAGFAYFAATFYPFSMDVVEREIWTMHSDQILVMAGIGILTIVAGLGLIYGSLRYENLKTRWDSLFGIRPTAAGD